MKQILCALILFLTFQAKASVYLETDVLHPVLNLTDSTNESSIDLRVGYILEKWDFSVRYYNVKGISHDGGTSGPSLANISISDAEDNYISARVGYKVESFTFGAGLGSYQREFDTNLGNNNKKNYKKDVLGLELFASYKWMFGSFFIKPEINYIAANVPMKAARTNGSSSYDISYNEPTMNLLVLVGYQF